MKFTMLRIGCRRVRIDDVRRKREDRVRVVHPYAWLWEPLEDDPTFVLRAMFGAKAAYVGGRLVLAFCAGEEPWRGLLVCTAREHHASLLQEFPALSPHPILPKWLYLPEAADAFESVGRRLVGLVRRRDLRIGVEPRARRAAGGSRMTGR